MLRFKFTVVAALTGALLSFELAAAPIVPPSVTAGFVNTLNVNSPLGSNLAPIVDFAAEYPFINYFRMARPWFSAPSDGSTFQDDQPLAIDGNGNVTTLAEGQFARTVLFTGIPADPGLAGRKLHLFYDGDGDFLYSNVDTINQVPGHDIIQLKTISSADSELIAIVTMTRNNPADPVRNIRLLPAGGICASNPVATVLNRGACVNEDFKSFRSFHQRILFNPSFLNNIKNYKSLRFMDWMRTNNSTQIGFANRPLPSHQFWSTEKGVPLEVMIALANLMDFDPWFNIPHRATDDYVRKFAAIVNNQLETGRRAYIEYSNEVWNGQFTQTGFVSQKGAALGLGLLDNGQTDAPTGMVRFYSKRAQRIFDLFEVAMGGTSRLRRTMATQSVVPYFTQEILLFEEAAEKTDVFAIAPYFGDTITDQTRRNELVSLGVDGVFDWLLNDNNAVLDFGALPNIDGFVQDQADTVAEFGIPLTTYEGGQHFLAAGAVANDTQLNALMDAVNRDPRMKNVYLRYLGNWRLRSNDVFHHFINSDRWSRFGRWGAKEFPTQRRADAPKFDALMTYIANRPLPAQ